MTAWFRTPKKWSRRQRVIAVLVTIGTPSALLVLVSYDGGGATFDVPGRCRVTEVVFPDSRLINTEVRESVDCDSRFGTFVTNQVHNGRVTLVLSKGRVTGRLYLHEVKDP